jgi:hypothetical protein
MLYGINVFTEIKRIQNEEMMLTQQLTDFYNETYKVEQILESEAIWAVFYKEQPFNLKSGSLVSSYPGPKYKKVSFSNPGHAHNLAKKLNKLFKTHDFEVYKLTSGEKVK